MIQKNIIIVDDQNILGIVNSEIVRLGNETDLNHIDVSRVTNMSFLFCDVPFNGDISKWDTSKVNNMDCMFRHSEFNNDISSWDVSNVLSADYMFEGSPFNGDISNWNLRRLNVIDKGLIRVIENSYKKKSEKEEIFLKENLLSVKKYNIVKSL